MLTLGLNFIAAPVTIHQLGAEAYGVFALLLTVISPLGIFDFGLGEATVKYMAEGLGRNARHEAEGYFRSTLMFNLIIGIVGALLLLLLAPWMVGSLFNVPEKYQGMARIALGFIGLNWALSMAAQTYIGALTALQHYRLISLGNLLAQGGTILVGLGVLLAGGNLLHLVLSQSACWAVSIWGWRAAVRRELPDFRLSPNWNPSAFRRTADMGVWQMGNKLGGLLAVRAQFWLLGAVLPVVAVGYYNLCSQMVSIIYLIAFRIGQVLFPEVSYLHGCGREGDAAQKVVNATWLVSSFALPGIAAMLFVGPDILGLWVGKSVATHAGAALVILSVANGISLVFAVPNFYLLGTGRSKWLAVMSVLQGSISFIAGLYWVPRMGLKGAALAVCVGTVVHLIVLCLIWCKLLRQWITLGEYLSAIFCPLLVTLLVGGGLTMCRQFLPAMLGPIETIGSAAAAVVVTGGVLHGIDLLLPGGKRRRPIFISLIRDALSTLKQWGKLPRAA